MLVRLFGLTLSAPEDLLLPCVDTLRVERIEAGGGSSEATAKIQWQSAPRVSFPSRFDGSHCRIGEEIAEVSLSDVGAVRAENGKSLFVRRGCKPDPESLRWLVASAGVPLLLSQQGILLFEGSAVRSEQGALALLGKVPNGKSNLCASLLGKGYSLVSDGIVAARRSARGIELLPGFPEVVLREDAIRALGVDLSELATTRPGVGRYSLPALCGFSTECSLLQRILVFPPLEGEHEGEEPSISEALDIRSSIAALTRCAYRGAYLENPAAGKSFFPGILETATTVQISRVVGNWNLIGLSAWSTLVAEALRP